MIGPSIFSRVSRNLPVESKTHVSGVTVWKLAYERDYLMKPCQLCEDYPVSERASDDPIGRIQSELEDGMGLAKCRKCGCMKEALETLQASLPLIQIDGASEVLRTVDALMQQIEPIEYACLGCAYCFPAVALNVFHQSFQDARQAPSPRCGFEVREQTWPPVPGEYFACCDGPMCPVAVATLGSIDLAETLARIRPKELCIVGKIETENIGIDKIIKNTVSNPTIRYLLLAGKDPVGHWPGKTLLALKQNGVDEKMKVAGAPSKRPILRNVTRDEVEAFRQQVQVVDLIGCEDEAQIMETMKHLAQRVSFPSAPHESTGEQQSPQISSSTTITAQEADRIEKMDPAGYFVIIPQPVKGLITVEHYSYDNTLLRTIEGTNAREVYGTIIGNGWVTQLSHAAYLGKELEKAELSIKLGFKYVQDGA